MFVSGSISSSGSVLESVMVHVSQLLQMNVLRLDGDDRFLSTVARDIPFPVLGTGRPAWLQAWCTKQ